MLILLTIALLFFASSRKERKLRHKQGGRRRKWGQWLARCSVSNIYHICIQWGLAVPLKNNRLF